MHRLLRIRISPQPHEILMAAAATLVGLVGFAVPEEISVSVAALFPSPWARVFYAGMGVFGAVVLGSVFCRKVEGRLVERVALLALACFFAAFAIMVIETRGLGGLVSSIIPAAWAAGNIWRARQIGQDLRLLRAYLVEHPGEHAFEAREAGPR